jgi:Trk K+ transport system NAD-binding subunit
LELEIGESVFSYPPVEEEASLNSLIIRLMYVIFPLLGTVIIVIGLIETGLELVKTDINIEVAKLVSDHIIIIGLGHVGCRITEQLELLAPEIPIVAIDKTPPLEFIEQRTKTGKFAFIEGDGSHKSILNQANVSQANRIHIVTDNDTLNFKIAIKAKRLNPDIRCILRIWDQEFADKIKSLSEVDFTISTSQVSAPLFVASSFMSEVKYGFRTGNDKKAQTLFLADFDVFSMLNITVGELETKFPMTILSINNKFHPKESEIITTGVNILVLGELDTLKAIEEFLSASNA